MGRELRCCYLGNFGPSHSTESHVAASLESLGHTVIRIQEGETPALEVADIVLRESPDFYVHTQTYGYAVSSGSVTERATTLEKIQASGVPTVFYHLDKWMGLNRIDQLTTEPWTKSDFVFSTDGGHDDDWKALGINHIWLPPGVYHAEAHDGTPRRQFTSDVAFVGSWRHYGHEEHWPIRRAMLQALRKKYGKKFRCWPVQGAIRGQALNDLYASVNVVVGDCCLAGTPRYWSDRIPETTGRGGFLVHPYIESVLDWHPSLVTFPPRDWSTMIDKVDYYLRHDHDRRLSRHENAEYTRTHNTYRHRMEEVIRTIGLAG